jgi:hypothetical protein
VSVCPSVCFIPDTAHRTSITFDAGKRLWHLKLSDECNFRLYLGHMLTTAIVIVEHVDGVRLSLNCDHQRAYCSSPSWYRSMEGHGGMISTGRNRKARREACPSDSLTATNSMWTDPVANPGLRSEFAFYLTTLFQWLETVESNEGVINEWWIGTEAVVAWFQGTIPALAWRDWGKRRKSQSG